MLPWKDTRLRARENPFHTTMEEGEGTFTELCRQLGMSRKTGF